jgi:hypothetical protein
MGMLESFNPACGAKASIGNGATFSMSGALGRIEGFADDRSGPDLVAIWCTVPI